jgi:hypothetical protein
MSQISVISEPAAVSERLHDMQLREEILRDAIYQAHLHRVRLTPNHPRIFPGLEMWGWSVASFREQGRSLGWEPLEVSNFSLTVQQDLGLAIAIASGDENTGRSGATPTTRSKKGPNTADAVEMNRQADMFSDLLPDAAPEPTAAQYDNWFLLHFTDASNQEIRIELSRPSSMGDDGKISSWTDRILLTPISTDGDAIKIAPPAGPEVEIEIRRKS